MARRQKHRSDPSDLNNAQFLTLDFRRKSAKAQALADKLQQIIMGPRDKLRGRGRPPNDAAVANAALLIAAEIIDVAKGDIRRTVHHGLSPANFTGQEVSFRHFTEAAAGLEKHKLVRKTPGSWNKATAFATPENPGVGFGHNTRWHPTQKLIDLCRTFGITHRSIERHFEIMLPKEPIALRESSRTDWRRKIRGRMIKFPETQTTIRLTSEVTEINEFLKGFKLTGATHRGYRRIYNQGDDPKNYGWNKGGRLYGSGSVDNYLIIKKAKRRKILIDGEKTVEIDVRASFLTIFHALHDTYLDIQKDPYKIQGLPRYIVKMWMVIGFGMGKHPTKWTSEAVQEFREKTKTGKEIGEVYSLSKLVTPKILEALPVLRQLKPGGIDCFDLMSLESNAIVATMLRLLRADRVPAFSVHDCLIVKNKDQELAQQVLLEEYHKATGAIPYLKVT